MKAWLRRLACAIGLHDWEQSRPIGLQDGFPFAGVPYENPTRHCKRCPKHQRWLPGYGGSEWGCWCPEPDRVES